MHISFYVLKAFLRTHPVFVAIYPYPLGSAQRRYIFTGYVFPAFSTELPQSLSASVGLATWMIEQLLTARAD
jgi:hypothetical protein